MKPAILDYFPSVFTVSYAFLLQQLVRNYDSSTQLFIKDPLILLKRLISHPCNLKSQPMNMEYSRLVQNRKETKRYQSSQNSIHTHTHRFVGLMQTGKHDLLLVTSLDSAQEPLTNCCLKQAKSDKGLKSFLFFCSIHCQV